MTTTDSYEKKTWEGWEQLIERQPPKGCLDPNGKEWKGIRPVQKIQLLRTKDTNQGKPLVVVLHGLALPCKVNSDSLRGILTLLFKEEKTAAFADLLLIDYPNDLLADFEYLVKGSVADVLSASIGTAINEAVAEYAYENIILLGHSFGSLLARRVLVDAVEQNRRELVDDKKKNSDWSQKVSGMVVLAGTNLGFQYQKTDDRWISCIATFSGLLDKFLPWFVDACVYLKLGTLVAYAWRNSPWVIDTRLKWLRLYEGNKAQALRPHKFRTLYISATKDQLVGRDDLQMVYQLGDWYCEREIENAYHADFLDQPGRGRTSVAARLRADRETLLNLQTDIRFVLQVPNQQEAPSGWEKIVRVSQLHGLRDERSQQQTTVDQGEDRTVVFLIHGIRDNAEWQEDIDYQLRKLHELLHRNSQSLVKPAITIAQVRYGYFNALQFLFPSERKRAVRAFSDEYLRVLARFPDLKQENIHVYAHSNGTFVFGQALKQYKEIRVNRVLMGGSVLPTNFPWGRFVNPLNSPNNLQVQQLLNYAANNDLPTGLLCRGLSYLPGVEGPLLGVGPGGTDGFIDLHNFKRQDPDRKKEQDKKKTAHKEGKLLNGWNFYLPGGHGATLEPGTDSPRRIAEYLLGRPPESGDSIRPFSQEDLHQGLDPFFIKKPEPTENSKDRVGPSQSSSPYVSTYWSMYRDWLGTLLSAFLLVLFLMLLLSLLGLLPIVQERIVRLLQFLGLLPFVLGIKAWFLQFVPVVFVHHLLDCIREFMYGIPCLKKILHYLNIKVLLTMLLAYFLSRF